MKYVVTLKKVIEKVVIIDAENDKEADNKIRNNLVEKKYEKIKNMRCYGDWEYISDYTVENEDDLITNEKDLLKHYGCGSREELQRDFYRYTDYGMPVGFLNNGISLTGYVEGCDGDMPNENLKYPFTVQKLEKVIDNLEAQADELWHEWNDMEEE